jgi:CubicO group peptidase (beta-lactamase class C family)
MASAGMLTDLQAYADDLVADWGGPAVSIAIAHDKQLLRAAAGTLNMETGVAATLESVFQVGSIAKVLTASVIMLLVERHQIELDRPVKSYLHGFHVADSIATEKITVRHLLSHTSGLISDSQFSHDEPYDEANGVGRYVDRCFSMPQAHRQLGERFSYSNAGYVIAGRLIEVVTGLPWYEAIKQHIFKPLQLTHSLTRPTDALRFRAAMGHFVTGIGKSRRINVAPYSYLTDAGPGGATATMSATDLVRLGQIHLTGGRSDNDDQWMSNQSVDAMQEAQIAIPAAYGTLETHWGLGWYLFNWHGISGFGHAGGTIGQEAILHIIPEFNCVLSVLSNGTRFPGLSIVRQVSADVLFALGGVRPAELNEPMPRANSGRQLTGCFVAGAWRLEVTERDAQLQLTLSAQGAVAPESFILKPLDENRFAMCSLDKSQLKFDQVTFVDFDAAGVPQRLYWGHRLHPREVHG